MLNFFNTKKYDDYLDRLRAQVGFNFVLFTGASQLLGLLFIISDPSNYVVFMAEVAFSTLSAIGSLVIINRGWFKVGIRFYMITMMFYLFLCTYLNGMLNSIDITALLVVVFVSGVLIDKIESFIYFLIIIVFLIALYFIQVSSGFPPNSIVLSDTGYLFWLLMVLVSAAFIQFIVNQPIKMLFLAIEKEKFEKARYMAELEDQNIELERINRNYKIEKERANVHSKLQSTFLSNMSKEVKYPMTEIMKIASRLGLEDISPNQQKQLIALLHYQTKELLSLMNEIVDKSKIESEQLILNSGLNSLRHLINRLESVCISKSGENELNFGKLIVVNELSVAQDLAIFDEDRVFQILSILLLRVRSIQNVVEVLLRVSIKENRLHFTVKSVTRNNTIQRIGFASFNTTKIESETGVSSFKSGMGLSIALGLANLMNGKIVEVDPLKEYNFSLYYRGKDDNSKT